MKKEGGRVISELHRCRKCVFVMGEVEDGTAGVTAAHEWAGLKVRTPALNLKRQTHSLTR